MTDFLKQAGLVLLCLIWLCVGLIGHHPWKPDEAYTFGVVYHILRTGEWLIPTLAGEPFVEKPPIFFIVAAFTAQFFSPWLPLHDGARLASGLFVGLALLFLARTSIVLNGRGYGWVAVFVLIGCIGLFYRAHQLITDTALWAGLAIGLYGLSRSPQHALSGGIALGVGAGLSFLAKGLLGPGLLGLTALLLPMFQAWRTTNYYRALVSAGLIAVPLLIAWPLALYAHAPKLFDEWFWDNNFGRFLGYARLGPQGEPFYYLKNLLWLAWPAWPLALWTLWLALRRYQGGWARPAIQLPLMFFIVTFTVLALANDARELYAIPLLLPLALLAAVAIDSLPRSASAALDWFGIMVFGTLALMLWAAWLIVTVQTPAHAYNWLSKYRPGYIHEFAWVSFLVALFLSLAWFALVRPARQSNRRTLVNWAAGITLVWGIAFSFGQSAADYGNSYQSVVMELRKQLPVNIDCLASSQLGEPQRAMLHYYADLITMREEVHPKHTCRWLLVQGDRDELQTAPTEEWRKVWEGSRPGDVSERLRLYVKELRLTTRE